MSDSSLKPSNETVDFPGKWILGTLGIMGMAYFVFKLQTWLDKYGEQEQVNRAVPINVNRAPLPRLIGEMSEEEIDNLLNDNPIRRRLEGKD